MGEPIKIQDAGGKLPDPLPKGAVVYYHTHGRRQWYGTCKLHKDPNCWHLVRWEPGYVGPGRRKTMRPEERKKFQLGKTLMREWAEKEGDISERQRCGTCWPATREYAAERRGT